MGGFFQADWIDCLMRARYQEKSSATPSGRPALPAPSPPPPPCSAGSLEARRFLISEALGPAGAVDFGAEVLVSEGEAEDTETFFLVLLTLTWCFAGVSGWGMGAGLVTGRGLGSVFGVGLGSGLGSGVGGVGVGSGSSSAEDSGGTDIFDFGFWMSDAG